MHRPDLGADTLFLYHRCFEGGVAKVCLSVSSDRGASIEKEYGAIVAPMGDHPFAVAATVAKVGSGWAMVYEEGGTTEGTYWASSTDGIAWTLHGPLWPGSNYRATPGIYTHGEDIFVFYAQRNPPHIDTLSIIFSSGKSMTDLVQYGGGYVLIGSAGWEAGSVSMPRLFFDGSYHYMIYEGATQNLWCGEGAAEQNVYGWGIARSADLIDWQPYAHNPIVQSADTQSCGHDMPQPLRLPTGEVFIYHTSDDASHVVRRVLARGSACGPDMPPPHWREKNDQCMPSCGGLGGTACYQTKDCQGGLTRAGQSWDCASCCK